MERSPIFRTWKRGILLLMPLGLLSAQPADTIYYNGKIITEWDAHPLAEAVAIRGNPLS